ncbi:MAG: hypothetical protein FJ388_04445 [Verrucomicrobia bacterium]|nr:hypothetical protein [Verrucomicrobiota bacterium]
MSALTTNPKVGEVATLDLGGGVTIELMGIPLGEFMLGSTKEEQAWANANGCDQIFTKCEGEQPHKAAMKRGFWLGRTEVTVVQWKQFINARSYVTDAESKGSVEWVPAGAKKEGASWRDPRFGSSLKDSVPVTCVSWNDAMAFCDSLNNCEQKAGRLPSGYKARLPTEAEWEYACRAGTQTKFWWGDTKEGGNMCLNWAGAADGFDFVSPVDHYGARGRNKFSLADMLGNVCEWCLDEFDPAGAHGQPYKGNPSGRVARGGSFRSYPGSARCAARGTGKPLASNSFTGFRVCIGPDVLGSAATTAAPVTPADPQPSTISPQPSALSAFCREVAALPAEAQVQRVAVKLKELNPGFDGKAEHKIEAQSVTKITVDAFQLENLAPLRALIHLQMLVLKEVNFQRSRLEDLSPLQGMPLVHLSCGYNRVSDLSPLHGMPLRVLRLSTSLVKDLSPLVDSPLTHLEIQCTKVRDLSPVCAGNLTTLFCHLTPVTDLSPLRRTKLKELKCDFVPNRDMAILRSIKTLETINGLPAAEFWKRVEAGEAPQAK